MKGSSSGHGGGHGGHGGGRGRNNDSPKGQPVRHAAGSRVSPTKAEEKRWENISSAYGDIPGVTPVRAETNEDGMMENPEEGRQHDEEEELPSAMAAAQHGIKVESGGSKVEESGVEDSPTKNEAVAKGVVPGAQVDLDGIIGGSSTANLDALISPRPGEKGAAPMDEGKVAEEGKEGE